MAKKGGVDVSASRMGPVHTGKLFKVRAISLGQYGRPIANLIQPGTVFNMAVSDLEPLERKQKEAEAVKHDGTREARIRSLEERQTVTFDGVEYLLPLWVEDAKKPAVVDETDEDEAVEVSTDQNVI